MTTTPFPDVNKKLSNESKKSSNDFNKTSKHGGKTANVIKKVYFVKTELVKWKLLLISVEFELRYLC